MLHLSRRMVIEISTVKQSQQQKFSGQPGLYHCSITNADFILRPHSGKIPPPEAVSQTIQIHKINYWPVPLFSTGLCFIRKYWSSRTSWRVWSAWSSVCRARRYTWSDCTTWSSRITTRIWCRRHSSLMNVDWCVLSFFCIRRLSRLDTCVWSFFYAIYLLDFDLTSFCFVRADRPMSGWENMLRINDQVYIISLRQMISMT